MSLTIPQNLFIRDSTVITIVKCSDDAVAMRHLQPLLDTTDCALGIAATYGKQCQLASIAFCTQSHVLVVNVPARHVAQPTEVSKRRRVAQGRNLIEEHLLLNQRFRKYAFKMDQLAVALHLDLSVRINTAVDMLSVTLADRQSLQALMDAMGGETKLQKHNVQALFFPTSKAPMSGDPAAGVALQAWAAFRAATLPRMSLRFASLPRIDTKNFPKEHLDAVAGISRNTQRIDAMKPAVMKNDVQKDFSVKKNNLNLVCRRYPTRIKRSTTQVLQIRVEGEGSTSQMIGRPFKIDGRSVHVKVDGPVQGGKILSVLTIGKDEPTHAESTRQDVIFEVLRHGIDLLSNPFFQALWLPNERPVWPKFREQRDDIPVQYPRALNISQHIAVQRILSKKDSDRVVVIQGPPGTGKTTVIAASIISYHHAKSSQGIWVAAQSNVAVKNIAERLAKDGFDGFRILVSKDFHYDWHEHLYTQLEHSVIRSDDFKDSIVDASTQLFGCRVVLCALSMFSNPRANVYTRILPVEMLILDEASQIECGDYLPVFHLYPMLSKIVFIGDDRQLPPHGQEEIPELSSVFEFPHLRNQALFLDTQYRMPHIIGAFISQNVYDGGLITCHSPTTSSACCFVDVNSGEEVKQGASWINREEAQVVTKLARLYQLNGRSFRIITPYDAQRTLIEKHLKDARLQWKDKVFNVDSFQGNENDYIIVSVVRSRGLGFLKNERRTNVMLTRCKAGMIICSSRDFLNEVASKTLVGKLAASLREENWIDAVRYR